MYQIQNLTADANQTQNLVLPDGTIVQFSMTYAPQQYCWFANIVYGTFILNGLMLSNNPNLLFQWKNILPFGLGCFSTQDREPTQQQDFFANEAQLYVLTIAEVAEYQTYLEGGSL